MLRTVKLFAFFAIVATVVIASLASKKPRTEQPPAPIKPETNNSALIFDRGAGGHFFVQALVDGVMIDFIVDTGASVVVLSPNDAERLGLQFSKDDYTWQYQSANGVGYAAPIEVNSLSLGAATAHDVPAVVIQQPMTHSLLGQSFLRNLTNFQVQGDQLIITP